MGRHACYSVILASFTVSQDSFARRNLGTFRQKRERAVLQWVKGALPVFQSDWPYMTKMRVNIAEILCKTGIYFRH